MKKSLFFLIFISIFSLTTAQAQDCVQCHKDVTPNIVTDWQLSKHSQNEVGCSVCHGDLHKDPYDVDKV